MKPKCCIVKSATMLWLPYFQTTTKYVKITNKITERKYVKYLIKRYSSLHFEATKKMEVKQKLG